MSLKLRPATEADLLAYIGRSIDPAWRPWMREWCGHVVERDGALVGIGVFSAAEFGGVWAWVDAREKLPAALVHRTVLAEIEDLRQRGITAVHCYRDETIPGSERWLRRLGFVPAPELSAPSGKVVWRCSLST